MDEKYQGGLVATRHLDEADPHVYDRSEASRSGLPPARASTEPELGVNHDTIELFRRLDSDLWESSGHNPVLMLGRIEQQRLEEAAADDSFISHPQRVCHSFDDYITSKASWFNRAYGAREKPLSRTAPRNLA